MTKPPPLFALLTLVSLLLPLPSLAQSKASLFPPGCLDCHGSEAKFPVRGVRAQYVTSGHHTLGNASYSNSEGCQRCHTNEGFIEYARTGKSDPKQVISNPSEIGCFTCHSPHERGDFSLRKTDAVKLVNGAVFDKGKSNVCANCHQARVLPSSEVKSRAIPYSHWGAHHGPNSDMLLGTNAYEWPGKKYSNSAHSVLPDANCVTCHMTQPKGRYALKPGMGGHSMRLAGEVHEVPKANAAGCQGGGCHNGMKSIAGKEFYDKKAANDYDGDGKIESAQEEVTGLLDKFVNKQGTGVFQTRANPLYDAKGTFVEGNKSQQPLEVVAALYDYKFVLEDGSKGVHNTKYAVQLLMDSLKALDKSYDDSRRPQ